MRRSLPSRPDRAGRVSRSVLGVLLAVGMTTTACGSSAPTVRTETPATGATNASATTNAAQSSGSPTGATTRPSAASPAKSRKAENRLVPEQVGSNPQKIIVSDVSLVARATGASVRVFPTDTSTSPRWTLKNPLPSGAPLVFLVQERRGDRLRVLVPVRPNESQGWVRAADVALSQHSYRIVVSVGKRTLTVYNAGKSTLQVPVGLGTGSTPTPGGVFYTKELLQPSNPGGAYGPYAYGLSGYSTVLENFGGGDGELGIHGTNDPASIGKNVSHGCIRMSNANITKLAKMLPLGVPVQIVS